ncbi:MAG: ABC transporter substrate-binding protein [Tissierellia bacterium]|nr:ABC transporter substrate-binding protein [Tissierellia bacterium]MDD4780599.1 ABC transporter substrate-binding protein [Tissierellia bacterium]
MKLNILKKITAIGLCIPMIITGCSNDKVESNKSNDEKESEITYKIGITEYMEHPSLDAAREGFVDEMEKLGINIEVDYVNAQGDTSNTQVIAEKFAKDKVDLIYSIATLSTQAAKKATENTDIPVLFTAVTDPVYSQIVKATDEIDANVTGVTDKVEAKEILKLAKDLKDGAKVVGIIYNTGESNSEIQIEEVKAAASELYMTVETVGITSVNDIPQAMNTLAEKIDVLYMISDNMVASAIQLVSNLAIEKNIITLSTIESQAADGVLISNGLSYTELGRQTAAMAKKILVDKVDIKDIHVESPTELKKIVNSKTMEALGLTKDNKAFEGAEFLE